ncbi:MAG TPA: hypothetical protein VJC03_06440, partial [bacterium]|nr:hypothetical protein [bacterium]
KNFGVEYMQYTNVDNLLNPIGDPYFVGEHIMSRNQVHESDAAHVSLILIPKDITERLGNVILVKKMINGREELVPQSIDYGAASPEINSACRYGDPSVRIMTVDTLAGSRKIYWTVAKKSVVDQFGKKRDVWKFERSSSDKRRYGALVGRPTEEVFASIKKKDADAQFETPASAAKLQSDFWKKVLHRIADVSEQFRGIRFVYDIPESAILELPWGAELLSPVELQQRLEEIGFPFTLEAGKKYYVTKNYTQLLINPTPYEIEEAESEEVASWFDMDLGIDPSELEGEENLASLGWNQRKDQNSKKWEGLVIEAGRAVGRDYVIPASSRLRLPEKAVRMTPLELAQALEKAGLPEVLKENFTYTVSESFDRVVSSIDLESRR